MYLEIRKHFGNQTRISVIFSSLEVEMKNKSTN